MRNPLKRRKSRISYCEWNSQSFGNYNKGGIICGSCNFSRTIMRNETFFTKGENKITEDNYSCPSCSEKNWWWLPPIARVPRKSANKRVWKKFWQQLKNKEFNHPKDGCI